MIHFVVESKVLRELDERSFIRVFQIPKENKMKKKPSLEHKKSRLLVQIVPQGNIKNAAANITTRKGKLFNTKSFLNSEGYFNGSERETKTEC